MTSAFPANGTQSNLLASLDAFAFSFDGGQEESAGRLCCPACHGRSVEREAKPHRCSRGSPRSTRCRGCSQSSLLRAAWRKAWARGLAKAVRSDLARTSSCSEQAKYCATNRGGYDDPVSSGDCAKNSHKPDSAGNKLYNDHDSNDNNNCRENDISSKDHRPPSTTHDGHDTELTAQSHCNKSNSHSNNDKDDNNNKNNDDAHNNNNIHDNNTNDNNNSYCSHHFLSLAAVFLSVQTRDK
ncbi:unnamed protein product, partial [Polarella glacialis]